MIRQATKEDEEQIEKLLKLCFGRREYYNNIENFIVYEIDSKIVAMTGLIYSKEYKALEVDWTCTHPEYRHKGYMQELFKYMLSYVRADVYCSCWRMPGKEINLHTIMKMYDFKEVAKPRVQWVNGHNCFRNKTDNLCAACKEVGNCNCYEDLYLRKYKENE